jgi:ABC-type antimicrobial peptide transport system permease subunit
LHGQELLFAKLSGTFGGLALLLACIGLYGVMSHTVLRRTAEIGVRMALGAGPANVLRMILRESLSILCLGLVTGIAIAAAMGRFVASLLFGLSATDLPTYAMVVALLAATALIASMAPAVRASHIDPAVALKRE